MRSYLLLLFPYNCNFKLCNIFNILSCRRRFNNWK